MELVVATTRRWVADELEAAALRRGITLVHSWGLDAPNRPDACWWTPIEHASRLRRVGLANGLVSPGPAWAGQVPGSMLGRGVWAGKLSEAPERDGFWKLGEIKHPDVVASVDSCEGFKTRCERAGIADDTMVIHSEVTDFDVEHRLWVACGRVVASSPYLVDGEAWFEGMTGLDSEAEKFGQLVVDAVPGPGGYVLDVGRTPRGWAVVEANPAWSSATYRAGLDAPDMVVETLVRASEGGRWRWEPDPYLVRRAARMAPLEVR